MPQVNRTSGGRSSPRTIEGKTRPAGDQGQQQAFQQYQTGLQLVQEGKFEKAIAIFQQLVENGPPEVLERSRIYLSICERNAGPATRSFSTPEEEYDYAISLLNTGDYEEARDRFDNILRNHPKADYAFYGLAILESMTGQVEECLEHLGQAIDLNPRNRIQARSDSDFQDMVDDPRFTELLYPESLEGL